jgi:hypothetical protein
LNRSVSGSIIGIPGVPEEGSGTDGDGDDGAAGGRKRATSSASSLSKVQEEDDDRVDARNAASRLAQTTF